MFTEIVNLRRQVKTTRRRRPGRPSGRTAHGLESRRRLYETAVDLIAARGYEATTLRDVADRAGVSVGLLYRYFPNKRAVVLALYDELSSAYAARAAAMPAGTWRDRFLFAVNTSLQVLRPHRTALTSLVPVLVGGASEGLFSPATDVSRRRALAVFQEVVAGATDAPRADVAPALGRLLYLCHLLVLLWWLLDRSPAQKATSGLVVLIERALPAGAMAFRFTRVRSLVIAADRLFQQALLRD